MLAANEVKKKMMIMIDGAPFQVLDVTVTTPSARGASTLVKMKVRHLLTGLAQDKTVKASDKFAEADVEVIAAHFSYSQGDTYCFMDEGTFEMVEIPASMLSDQIWMLSEELPVRIMKYQGAPASVELPQYVDIKIAEAGIASQQAGSAGGGMKDATLVTGRAVKVPNYMKAGEFVRINSETGEVLGRA